MEELSQLVDGVLEAKSNTDCGMRSVILPYRERCKYTFGEKYTSWEAQGKFVFLKANDDKWNWIPNSLMEISCENDKYWVKPLKGNTILQNGENLDNEVRTRLEFGDELAFPKHRNGISGGLAIFLFKEREFVTNWDNSEEVVILKVPENTDELTFTPDENQLIFSHILSYLPLGSMKNARLVCKHWDEQISPILRKKSLIHFDAESNSFNASLQFSRYLHEMQNVAPWTNWKITYPDLPASGEDEGKWGDKYIGDLYWFLNPRRGHHVKSLSLKGGICSNCDYYIFLVAVTQFKDTLEELRLDFGMAILNRNGTEIEYESSPIIFKKLKKFSLQLSLFNSRLIGGLTATWMKSWADSVTGVESISTLGDASLGSRFVRKLQIHENYHNLRDILLTCKAEDGLDFLTELNQPLKKLTFTLPLENQHLPDFERLLEKFAGSLELLSFRISTQGLEEFSEFVLKFPYFPKLKSLDFHFGDFENKNHYEEVGDWMTCKVKEVARLSVAFPSLRPIEYERHFPAIRSLIVKPEFNDTTSDFWRTYYDLIDSLRPMEGQICKTLQHLELPTRDDSYSLPLFLGDVFPNARNEWMNRLRRCEGQLKN